MDEYWLAEAISAKQRDTWRKQGFTLSSTDDSWPIPDLGFLEKAISSWGRAAAAGNDAQVKRHMLKRARALGASKEKIKRIQALGMSTAEAEAVEGALADPIADWLEEPVAEADGSEPQGWEWDVIVARAGDSKNGRYYSEAVLRKAVPLFEGTRVLARSDDDHLTWQRRGTRVHDIVGWLSESRFADGAVRARLHISKAADWLRTMLLDAWQRGKRDLAGLSLTGSADGRETIVEGKRQQIVETIRSIATVDIVFNPAAGGGLVKLVAAEGKEGPPMDLDKFIELLAEASPTVAKELLSNADKELTDALREAAPELLEKIEQAKPAPTPAPPAQPALAIAEAVPDPEPDLEGLVSAPLSRFVVKDALSETKLPEVVKARISKRFVGKAFAEADLSEAIKDELDSWAELERDNLVTSAGRTKPDISVGVEEVQRAKAALDGFFLGESVEVDGEKVPAYRSFKHAYMDLTGDGRDGGVLTGRLPRRPAGKLGISEANGGRVSIHLHDLAEGEMVLSEAIATGGFTEILGDSVTRKMVADYARSNLRTWGPLVDVVPVADFRTNRRMRWGAYANLAAVAQGAAYLAMTSPTDEEATYAATKRGGTETINLEAIANDDVGFIRQVPTRMARAAAQTLHEFVFEFLNSNAAIYDAVALFAAGHNNLGTVALSTASLSAALLRMRKQTELNSAKRLGIVGRHLWVPGDLEETAFVLTASERKQGTADNDASFIKAKGIGYEVVDYWTDQNNWYLSAGQGDTPIIEIGFYGPEEPESFVQDMPDVGSMFTNDQVTLKIRHSYSGTVLDFRGMDGSLVA